MAPSLKQDMLSAIAGRPTARIPWAPRLDLWYKANQRADTLPEAYRAACLVDIVDDLGAGMHAIVPDFKNLRGPEDEVDRALGIYNLSCMPCRTVLENVRRTVRRDAERTYVEYHTPVGDISTVTLYDEGMRKAGITLTHVEDYAFETIRDYPALGFLFENARVEPNDEGYGRYAADVGPRGLAAGFVSLAASPMHLIQRDLMPLDVFFFEMYDHPDELNELARQIGVYWDRLLRVVGECPAEVVFLGANYDASVTYPPFFHEHIEPWLSTFAAALHSRGRYLLTHTDGENTGLLKHYLESRIDVADSICPQPMTKLSFKEVRDFFGGAITIMGGIPSVTLSPSSMPDKEFEAFLERFFEDLGRGDHLILGISDELSSTGEIERVRVVGQIVDDYNAGH